MLFIIFQPYFQALPCSSLQGHAWERMKMKNGLIFKESGMGKLLKEKQDPTTWGHGAEVTCSIGLRLVGHQRRGQGQLCRACDVSWVLEDECDFIRKRMEWSSRQRSQCEQCQASVRFLVQLGEGQQDQTIWEGTWRWKGRK